MTDLPATVLSINSQMHTMSALILHDDVIAQLLAEDFIPIIIHRDGAREPRSTVDG